MRVIILTSSLLVFGCGAEDEPQASPYEQLVQALGLGALAAAPNGLGTPSARPDGLGLPFFESGDVSAGPANCATACARLDECGIDAGGASCVAQCAAAIPRAGAAGQRLLDCVATARCSRVDDCLEDLEDELEGPSVRTPPASAPGRAASGTGRAADPDDF